MMIFLLSLSTSELLRLASKLVFVLVIISYR